MSRPPGVWPSVSTVYGKSGARCEFRLLIKFSGKVFGVIKWAAFWSCCSQRPPVGSVIPLSHVAETLPTHSVNSIQCWSNPSPCEEHLTGEARFFSPAQDMDVFIWRTLWSCHTSWATHHTLPGGSWPPIRPLRDLEEAVPSCLPSEITLHTSLVDQLSLLKMASCSFWNGHKMSLYIHRNKRNRPQGSAWQSWLTLPW